MKKQTTLTGCLLLLAALTFWVSWFLMPDPGTTDTQHILNIVKQSRIQVLCSVVLQIISSVLYIIALFLLVKISLPKRTSMTGMILFGIGTLGLCSDAFFHLLAYYMTGNSVTIQQDVITVMNFMQTEGLIFLVPVLLPLFIGSIMLSVGLNKQGVISGMSKFTFLSAIVIGVAGVIMTKVFGYKDPGMTLAALGVFALGQAFIGLELVRSNKEKPATVKFSAAVAAQQKQLFN